MSVALLLVGCTGPATVKHSGQGDEYSHYVSSMYRQPAVVHVPRTIEFPASLAVAEIGQTTPSPRLLEKLRKAPELFRHVGALPADFGPPGTDRNTGDRDPLPRLVAMARDQGADYLVICGAQVETRTRVTPVSALDLTIIGAFVIPSREIVADARASASMIDVRAGTVVLSLGAQTTDTRYASAVGVEGDEDRVGQQTHDQSIDKLADQFIAEGKRRAAEEAAFDAQR
ncbi:MAG TPA: hypothetical protein VH370_24335 [Humisphaera sp.]|nr:hypothetical protein [Humisphaera sp.]